MNWEKQDNELRRLMEGSGFLPEGEDWNEVAVWKKLEEKKQTSIRRIIPVGIPWLAAACVVVLLGLAWWLFQLSKTDTNGNAHLVEGRIKETQGIKNEGYNPEPGQNKPSVSTQIQLLVKEEVSDSEKALKESKVNQPQKSQVNPNTAIPVVSPPFRLENSNELPKEDLVAASAVSPENILEGIPEVTPESSVATVVPAPVSKPKMRVIHFNQLQGQPTTKPPVFVQAKNDPNDLIDLALQNPANRREPFQALKIDLSPAPKKSL